MKWYKTIRSIFYKVLLIFVFIFILPHNIFSSSFGMAIVDIYNPNTNTLYYNNTLVNLNNISSFVYYSNYYFKVCADPYGNKCYNYCFYHNTNGKCDNIPSNEIWLVYNISPGNNILYFLKDNKNDASSSNTVFKTSVYSVAGNYIQHLYSGFISTGTYGVVISGTAETHYPLTIKAGNALSLVFKPITNTIYYFVLHSSYTATSSGEFSGLAIDIPNNQIYLYKVSCSYSTITYSWSCSLATGIYTYKTIPALALNHIYNLYIIFNKTSEIYVSLYDATSKQWVFRNYKYILTNINAGGGLYFTIPPNSIGVGGYNSNFNIDIYGMYEYNQTYPYPYTIGNKYYYTEMYIINKYNNNYVSLINNSISIYNHLYNTTNYNIYWYVNNSLINSSNITVLNNSYSYYNYTTTLLKNGIYNISTCVSTNLTINTYNIPIKLCDYYITKLNLYKMSVRFYNLTKYNNTYYTGGLYYNISYRCGLLGYTLNITNNYTDGLLINKILCNNKTYTIYGKYNFTKEGYKHINITLHALYSNDDITKLFSVYFDKYKPTIIYYYQVSPESNLILNLIPEDSISPIVLCNILLNNITTIYNKTLYIDKPFTTTFGLRYGFNNLEIKCRDLVNHWNNKSVLVSIAPSIIKELEWRKPNILYVGQDYTVTGKFTVINVGNSPIIQPITESIPFSYGKDLKVCINNTDKCIIDEKVWTGPIQLQISNLKQGDRITYIISYKMPTAKIVNKKFYFVIYNGTKYNVIELKIKSISPEMLTNLYLKYFIGNCSIFYKALVDNSIVDSKCVKGRVYVYLGDMLPGSYKDVKILLNGYYKNEITPFNKININLNDIVNYINNTINEIIEYIKKLLNLKISLPIP